MSWLWGSVAHLPHSNIIRAFGRYYQRPVDAPRSRFEVTIMGHFGSILERCSIAGFGNLGQFGTVLNVSAKCPKFGSWRSIMV
jgi:hypothetical protein